jgi:glycosyltransferase involved in cell wall biosynthesis
VGDCFLSIGLDWDYGLATIGALKRRTGVTVVLGCYDTIPVDYPEVSSQANSRFFTDYFLEVGRVADKIFAISRTTKADLERLYRRLGPIRSPEIVSIRLGCHLPATFELRRRDDLGSEQLDCLTAAEGFVLYVSTIEARKNHRVLVQVWNALYRRHGRHIPELVLVGMPGWGVGDLMQELRHMDIFRYGLVRLMDRVSDDGLAMLYRSCLFSVFPSIYEGWGLGAVEAMSYGKLCIISDAPALVEATQGLCPALHPFDFPAWRDTITRYWQSVPERESLEASIRTSFELRTWREFGEDFENFLKAI